MHNKNNTAYRLYAGWYSKSLIVLYLIEPFVGYFVISSFGPCCFTLNQTNFYIYKLGYRYWISFGSESFVQPPVRVTTFKFLASNLIALNGPL